MEKNSFSTGFPRRSLQGHTLNLELGAGQHLWNVVCQLKYIINFCTCSSLFPTAIAENAAAGQQKKDKQAGNYDTACPQGCLTSATSWQGVKQLGDIRDRSSCGSGKVRQIQPNCRLLSFCKVLVQKTRYCLQDHKELLKQNVEEYKINNVCFIIY